MKTHGGMTYTEDKKETFALFDELVKLHGEGIAQPCCGYCGETTQFIVEDVITSEAGTRFSNPGTNLLFKHHLPIRVVLNAERTKGYIPVTVCIKCRAREEATMRYKHEMTTMMPPDLPERGYTDAELNTYRAIFKLKVGDLQREAEANQAETHRTIRGKR